MNYMGQNDLYNILEEFLLMKPVIKRFTVQKCLIWTSLSYRIVCSLPAFSYARQVMQQKFKKAQK